MKKINTILYVAILFIIATRSGAQVLQANVSVVQQQQNQWCWAANSECILKYYGFTTNTTQCLINNYAWSKSTCCTSPSGCNQSNQITGTGAIDDILTHFGSLTSTFYNRSLTVAEVKTALTDTRPFVIGVMWSAGGGHVVVGCAYNVSSSTLTFMDPWQNNGMTTCAFSGGTSISTNTGSGTWSQSLVVTSAPTGGAPVANFSANHQAICPGKSVAFTDQSSGTPTSWSWTFQGGNPSTSTQQNPTVSYAAPGTYSVSLVATNANGSNTSTQTSYITVTGVIALPLQESFTAAAFPPANWTSNNINNDTIFWERSATVGSQGSTASMLFDNYNHDAAGKRDEIQCPKYDFSSVSSASLSFDVAYKQYDNQYSDTLAVLVSSDCGTTFTNVYTKGGATLSSASGTLSANIFTPSGAAQWRNETISLNSFAGQGNVLVVFQNRGHYGQALYVDNINITSSTGMNSLNDLDQTVKIYPNPSTGIIQFELNRTENTECTVQLSDVVGRVVYSEKINTATYAKSMNLQNKGMYLFSVISEKGKQTKKVVVE